LENRTWNSKQNPPPSGKIEEAKRLAFKMTLNKGQKEEYKKRHDEIWPELKKLLKDAGISEYSIFLDEETNTLFAFQKVAGTGGSQDLGKTGIVQRWWKFMADIMKTNPDNSPVTVPLEEVFYME
jgi:L-rhamnose mutarotase